MRLLNLACGAVRPQGEEWVNLDNLHAALLLGTPERANLDAEPNYVNWDIENNFSLSLFPDETFDGILISHFVEHVDCQKAAMLMNACRMLLKPGGVLLVSVPDASVFRQHHHEDTVENAVRLFGESIFAGDGESSFAGYALWNRFHRAILSEDALWCYFVRAGFEADQVYRQHIENPKEFITNSDALLKMVQLLNRLPFSLIMGATKT